MELKCLKKDPLKTYIHHHLGLGDHIVCNGIVRAVAKLHGEAGGYVILAVKEENIPSVIQLYRDLTHLVKFHQVTRDEDCYEAYKKFFFLRIGFENMNLGRLLNRHEAQKGLTWERMIYNQLSIDYKQRYEGFHIERDYEREKILEDKLDLPEEFALCCTSSSEGNFAPDIRSQFKKIFLEKKTDSIFDWIGVIEKAKEIHCIDSAMFHLIKQVQPPTETKIFYDQRSDDPLRAIPEEDHGWLII